VVVVAVTEEVVAVDLVVEVVVGIVVALAVAGAEERPIVTGE